MLGTLFFNLSHFGLFQIVNTFVPDPSSQEPLLVENVPDPLAGEQVSIFPIAP